MTKAVVLLILSLMANEAAGATEDFARSTEVWIGPHPLNESLRSALLGVP